MRAAIGDIVGAPGGKDFVLRLLAECQGIAEANGHTLRSSFVERARGAVTGAGSTLTASMLRDIERQAPIEADHIIGDLIRRAHPGSIKPSAPSLLELAYTHLKAYEARLARTRK